MSQTENKWDLRDLYNAPDDPAIEADLAKAEKMAADFEADYRGKIDSPDLTAEFLAGALRRYEEIISLMSKSACYAYLVFAADTSKPEHGALMQKVQQRQSGISVKFIFFDLELMNAKPEIMDKLIADPVLANYVHFIKASRQYRDHRLSEAEETILEIKSNTGDRAFERLFDETIASLRFDMEIDGEKKELTEPEVLAYQRNGDRKLRIESARSLSEGLKKNARIITYIFNTLAWDKEENDKLRKYTYPQQSRNMSNELSKETVETVMKTCYDNYDIVSRYYNIKREILGVDKLYEYDRYAPLYESTEKVSFEEAKDIVLTAFGEFSPLMRKTTEIFFDDKRIDADTRPGKQGGAFCMTVSPGIPPYVLMNFLNRKDDVMTLAHELGHAVHGALSCENQTQFNIHTALPVAELASTFGEMLVFHSLVKKSSNDEKLALYAGKIEDIFATVFRQAAMYKFESEFHAARRERGELTTEEISDIWQSAIGEMFGDSLTLNEGHKYWWEYVGHFIGSYFYVYAYSLGELLVLSLYAMYKKQGKPFVEKFEKLLSTGGSCSPAELMAAVDIDITDPAFWQGGVAEIGAMVDEFVKLYNESK